MPVRMPLSKHLIDTDHRFDIFLMNDIILFSKIWGETEMRFSFVNSRIIPFIKVCKFFLGLILIWGRSGNQKCFIYLFILDLHFNLYWIYMVKKTQLHNSCSIFAKVFVQHCDYHNMYNWIWACLSFHSWWVFVQKVMIKWWKIKILKPFLFLFCAISHRGLQLYTV